MTVSDVVAMRVTIVLIVVHLTFRFTRKNQIGDVCLQEYQHRQYHHYHHHYYHHDHYR